MRYKVLYIHGITEIGGAERELLALMKWLDRRKWQPLVACPGIGPLVTELKAIDVPVYPMKFPAWRKLSHLPWRISTWLRLIKLVGRTRPALVHVNDLWWAPLGCMAAKRHRIPCVVTVRQNLKPRWICQYHLNRADMVVTVSNKAQAVLMAHEVPRECVRVIYSGVDTELFSPQVNGRVVRTRLSISPTDPVIGCVANILSIKGHDVLITAFSKVLKELPRTHCLLVGRDDSQYGTKMHALTVSLGIVRQTHFVGFQTDVRPYIAAMDLVVQTSRSEALGIALLEAMAMGKPVVGSNINGMSEVIQEGVTGILVPPEDSQSLASAVARLLQDPAGCRIMGQAGRQRVKENFSLVRMVEALQKIYTDLIDAT